MPIFENVHHTCTHLNRHLCDVIVVHTVAPKAHYDCNYGDTVVPLDWLFGSFIDAPPGSTKAAAAAAAAATTVESAKVVQEALDEGDEVEDNFDEEEVKRIQDELIPKALRFNSPGRKANLSIFVEGKRKRKSPARFVQK